MAESFSYVLIPIYSIWFLCSISIFFVHSSQKYEKRFPSYNKCSLGIYTVDSAGCGAGAGGGLWAHSPLRLLNFAKENLIKRVFSFYFTPQISLLAQTARKGLVCRLRYC